MKRPLLAIASLVVAAALSFGAAAPVYAQAPDKPKRFPQLTLDQLNDQQRPLGEKIVKISAVGLGGPYNPLLRSPVLAQRVTTSSITSAGIRRFRASSPNSPS